MIQKKYLRENQAEIRVVFASILLISAIIIFANHSFAQTPLTQKFDPEVQKFAFIIPNQKVPSGAPGLKASDCGTCHKTIYSDWRNSTHAFALHDIQYQSELTKKDSPKWLCLNCHIPVQNQRESIITQLNDDDIFAPVKNSNPKFDAELQQEGVTCITCHVRTDRETGKSYMIGPNGSTFAPHPVRQDRDFLRNICQRCHNPQGEALTENLLCWFETTKELAEGQKSLAEKFGEHKDCVDCHMPEQNRLVADNFTALPKRTVNRHFWTGSGIPKWYYEYDSLLARGYESALDVKVLLDEDQKLDAEISFEVVLKNARAGHYLPTGDPERFIQVKAAIEDKNGHSLQHKQLRIGQVWKWNPARKINDNRLKQGEERHWKAVLQVPENVKGMKLAVTAYHVRLKTETAKYIMQARNVDESLLENGNYYVKHLPEYYPFANYIFREEIDLASMKRKSDSTEELIRLSKNEKGKPLEERDY